MCRVVVIDFRVLFAYAEVMPIGFQEPTPVPDRMNGALLIAASLIAVVRLRGEELRPSPKLKATIYDSVRLAREILREVQRQ